VVKNLGKIKNIKDIELDIMDVAEKTYIQWLIGPIDGEEKIGFRRFVIKRGGSIPKHRHKEIYHIQYVLKGEYIVGIGDEEYRVKPGDIIYIKPMEPHWYKNDSNEDIEFLCIIPLDVEYEAEILE